MIKNQDKIAYILIIAGSILTIMIYKRMNEPSIKKLERRCYREFNTCYNGKVLDVSYSVNGETYWLNTKHLLTRQIYRPRCQERAKNKVEIGDSIYKSKGTWSFCIYKQANPDSVIFIKCDFDCSIYREGE
jgi:hypothetical protein